MGILLPGAAPGLDEQPPDGCAIRGEGGAVGTTEPGTVAELAAAKGLPEKFLREQGLVDLPRGGIGITYYDTDGQELFVRERGVPGFQSRFRQPAGVPLEPYGQWRLADQGVEGVLYIAEGETDTLTLWHHGQAALGLPGSNTCRSLQAEHLAGVTEVYVVPDNDRGGRTFRSGLQERLAEIGFAGRANEVRLPDGVKDVNELHLRSPERFREAIDGLRRYAAEMDLGAPDETLRSPDKTLHGPAKQGRGEGFVSFVRCRVGKQVAIPLRIEPYRPFPTALLPRDLARLVAGGSEALGCDPAYLALPGLAVLAAAVGNSRECRVKRDWLESMILWTVVVGDSGTLKTPAFKLMMRPIYDAQRQAREEYRVALARFEEAKAQHKAAAAQAKEAGHEPPPPPAPPTMRRAFGSDVTIEKLAEILEDNPRGILVARDELAGWLTSFTRYKQGGSSDVPNWLEIYGAGTIVYDRKGGDRRQVIVDRAAASVTGGIQPGILARLLTGEHYDSGLAARLLMAWPPRRPKRWTEVEIEEDVLADYCSLVGKLLKLPMRTTGDGFEVPHRRVLSPGAREAWVRFYEDFAREQADAEGALAAMLSKIEGVAARLTLLHHVATLVGLDCDDDRDISATSVEAGVGLARWFADEHRRIYACLGESDEQRQARGLIDWVRTRKGGRARPRELRRSNPRRYPDSAAAGAALDALVEAGLGRWEGVPTTDRGGRQTREFVLDPTPDKTDETPEPEIEEALALA